MNHIHQWDSAWYCKICGEYWGLRWFPKYSSHGRGVWFGCKQTMKEILKNLYFKIRYL